MRNGLKTTIGIAILIAALALATGLSAYFIRDDTGGDVLWNSSEAFFFIGISTRGLHVSWLGYPWFAAKQLMGGFAAVELPDDDRGSLIVIRVTSAGAERHDLKLEDRRPGSGPSMYTPRGGRIYANYPALGGLCVWDGDHFESATLEERRGFNGIDGLTAKDFDSGWRKRGFGVGQADSNFTINIGEKFDLSVNNMAVKESGHGGISIDMLYTGRAPIRI
jgi:hypothetical protein